YGRTPRYRWQDVVVSLCGPVPPLLFVGLPSYIAYRAGVFQDDPFLRQFLLDVWWVNLTWSIVNVLPVLPLDGGRVCDAWFGRRTARIASIVTCLLAFLASVTFLSHIIGG